jgi:hypothetical protein
MPDDTRRPDSPDRAAYFAKLATAAASSSNESNTVASFVMTRRS